ncbi:MAG: inositol monophosphatase family protein [archaeon]
MAAQEILSLFRGIGKEVRKIALDFYGTDRAAGVVRNRGWDKTILIDDLCEKKIIRMLEASGMGFTLASEETGVRRLCGNPEYTIVIDPVDGSGNAERGIPFFCVSLAAARDTLENTDVGYVMDLVHGNEYWAIKGKGSFQDGKRIMPRAAKPPYYVTTFFYPEQERAYRRCALLLQSTSVKIRCYNATALELCLVAKGTLHGMFDMRGVNRVTDFAAGKLILEEAGGIFSDHRGKPVDLKADPEETSTVVAACCGAVHRHLLGLVDPKT